jgi:hypothetical protein
VHQGSGIGWLLCNGVKATYHYMWIDI